MYPRIQNFVTKTGGMGNSVRQIECQKGLFTLSQMSEEQVLNQITNWPMESGLAGAI